MISFENDQYRKRARSPSPSPPPIRRLNDASIQATPASRRIQPSAKRTTINKEPIQVILFVLNLSQKENFFLHLVKKSFYKKF